uniref:Uncharacterized protein n=1 Tax=Zea mays TaxID=4577 RepID=A0A804UCK6_MAIZE
MSCHQPQPASAPPRTVHNKLTVHSVRSHKASLFPFPSRGKRRPAFRRHGHHHRARPPRLPRCHCHVRRPLIPHPDDGGGRGQRHHPPELLHARHHVGRQPDRGEGDQGARRGVHPDGAGAGHDVRRHHGDRRPADGGGVARVRRAGPHAGLLHAGVPDRGGAYGVRQPAAHVGGPQREHARRAGPRRHRPGRPGDPRRRRHRDVPDGHGLRAVEDAGWDQRHRRHRPAGCLRHHGRQRHHGRRRRRRRRRIPVRRVRVVGVVGRMTGGWVVAVVVAVVGSFWVW